MRQNTQNGTYITIRILKLKNNTLHNNKKYITIRLHKNDKECNKNNIKECDKRKSH
jgi:hypothetical protein